MEIFQQILAVVACIILAIIAYLLFKAGWFPVVVVIVMLMTVAKYYIAKANNRPG